MGWSDIPAPPEAFRAAVSGQPTTIAAHRQIGDGLAARLQETVGLKASDVVLDLGSGCGRVAVPLTEIITTGRYHGLDIVKPMVDWCTAEITSRYPNFSFHFAGLRNTLYSATGDDPATYVFPFPDQTFDLVFAASVFTHLVPASARQYGREIARVLKIGGRAFLTFFLTDDGYRRRLAAGLPMLTTFPHQRAGHAVVDPQNPEAVVAYEETDALAMLRRAGLVVDRVEHGTWSGRPGPDSQDTILATRPRRTTGIAGWVRRWLRRG